MIVIKHLISFLLLGILSFTNSIDSDNQFEIYNDESNRILWSSKRPIYWDDFQGIPEENKGLAVASTQCKIDVVSAKFENDLPRIVIATYFLKDSSWTITNDVPSLKHEQLHFDIYELYARKLRKKFVELNNDKIVDINIYQNFLYSIVKEGIERNEQYDEEVYFNEEKQKEWSEVIASELNELEQYVYAEESE